MAFWKNLKKLKCILLILLLSKPLHCCSCHKLETVKYNFILRCTSSRHSTTSRLLMEPCVILSHSRIRICSSLNTGQDYGENKCNIFSIENFISIQFKCYDWSSFVKDNECCESILKNGGNDNKTKLFTSCRRLQTPLLGQFLVQLESISITLHVLMFDCRHHISNVPYYNNIEHPILL